MNIFDLKKVIAEFREKHPKYILKESEQKQPFQFYNCYIDSVTTDFCYVEFGILHDEYNDSVVRIIIVVNSKDRHWRAFQEFSTEWRVQELTIEKLETCLRNFRQILHNVRCEEQRIQKSFKISIRKNKIFKDSLEEVV